MSKCNVVNIEKKNMVNTEKKFGQNKIGPFYFSASYLPNKLVYTKKPSDYIKSTSEIKLQLMK